MIKKALAWCAGFFSEGSKGTSSTRLIMIGSTFLVVFVWAFVSLRTMTVQDMPAGLIVFVSLCLGLKGFQATVEAKKETRITQLITNADVAKTEAKADAAVAVAEAEERAEG